MMYKATSMCDWSICWPLALRQMRTVGDEEQEQMRTRRAKNLPCTVCDQWQGATTNKRYACAFPLFNIMMHGRFTFWPFSSALYCHLRTMSRGRRRCDPRRIRDYIRISIIVRWCVGNDAKSGTALCSFYSIDDSETNHGVRIWTIRIRGRFGRFEGNPALVEKKVNLSKCLWFYLMNSI